MNYLSGAEVKQQHKGGRISVYFPADHPVWRQPPELRAALVKERVDISYQLEHVLGEILTRQGVMFELLCQLIPKVDLLLGLKKGPEN